MVRETGARTGVGNPRLVLVASFAALLFYGGEVYQQAPPIPGRVVTTEGELLYTRDDILAGQDVWRTIGGQELGSIWGHGYLRYFLRRIEDRN